MVRAMEQKVALAQSVGNTLAQHLKDQILELMVNKSKSEIEMMNRISALEKEWDLWKSRAEAPKQGQSPAELKDMQREIRRLVKENSKLNSALSHEKTV